MSFDQKNMENDDLNIQSHLNTSLELDGISVSEDLINRTLIAIKNQSAKAPAMEETIKESESKTIPWTRYIRNFAAIAAAGFILLIGFNNLAEKSMKKDEMQNSAKNYDYDMKASEASPESSINYTANAALDTGTSQSIYKADNNSNELPQMEEYSINDSTGNDMVSKSDVNVGISASGAKPKTNAALNDLYNLTFGDICPILVDAAESVNITEGVTNNSIFLSNRADIGEFYNLVSSFAFAEGSQSSGSNSYIIRINSTGASFTLTVENNHILTSYTYGEDKVEGRYDTADHELLLLELEKLFLKYNQ